MLFLHSESSLTNNIQYEKKTYPDGGLRIIHVWRNRSQARQGSRRRQENQ
jgi:hypothetical protein